VAFAGGNLVTESISVDVCWFGAELDEMVLNLWGVTSIRDTIDDGERG
jgi:hypothetical protein